MINYYLLIKPGIIFGNLVTFTAGFLLATQGEFDWKLFIVTLLGLAFIIASACIFNNYIDRKIDREMARTKERALAAQTIPNSSALIMGTFLYLLGTGILFAKTNLLTLTIANLGFIVYVGIYSLIKSRTDLSSLIGSVAGAIPPVVGYTAVSHQLDAAAFVLFFILVFWQMPHFFAIGIWHLNDYAKANLPILPVSKGIMRTKIHMVLYILVLLPTISLLTLLGYTGDLFLGITTLIGIGWLFLCLKGFYSQDDQLWGRQMFRVSLILINAICLLIYLDGP